MIKEFFPILMMQKYNLGDILRKENINKIGRSVNIHL